MSVYGALLARPGARALACACALGWLSFGGLMLGIVLAAEQASGSFATAGAAAGAFAAASALLAPLRGRLVDRRGPAALLACALVHAAALCAFAWVAGGGGGAEGGGAATAARAGMAAGSATVDGAVAASGAVTGVLVACAAAAGASAPPLIAAARALWPRVAGPDLIRAGHALNALLGDLGGIAGPALAATLVTVATAAVAPAALALGPLAGALLLARVASRLPAAPAADLCHPMPAHGASDDTGPARGGRARRGARARRRGGVMRGNRGMQVLLAADLVAGLALGTAEVLAPAQADAAGAPQLAALPLMLLAAASAVAALRSGRAARRAPAIEAARGIASLAVALPAGLAVGALIAGMSPPLALAPLCAACLLAGAGHGRFTVALLELLDTLVPARNAVEALTWLTSAQGAGLALGAVAGGWLAS